jgi:prepilin-type N-terminal cleavage/methylation domain-containing protein
MSFKRVRKAFTLIELIIVIILISISYYLIFSSSNFKIENENNNVSLKNIKKYLIKNFEFENELSIVCIDENLVCYIKIDGIVNEDIKIENLFQNKPNVYEYKKEEEIIDYESIDIDNISQDVFFELKINNDYKTNELVVDTINEKVYLFNSIFNEVKIYSSLQEVFETFNTNQLEVQDAF